MLKLPRKLPPDVRALLGRELEDLPLQEVMPRVASMLLRLFNARDLLFLLFQKDGGTDKYSPLLEFGAGGQGEGVTDYYEKLLSEWRGREVNAAVLRDLERRQSCISYSAFSWPYPSVTLNESPTLAIPREYTLLLPVSSELIVAQDSEPIFLGYFAIFFDTFPPLNESLVQLIVTLPETLSDVLRVYLAERESKIQTDMAVFAHEQKRILLTLQDQVLTLRSAGIDSQHEVLDLMARNTKRLLQQITEASIVDRVEQNALQIHILPLDLNTMVREAVEQATAQFALAKIQLRLELAEDLPLTAIDPALFPTVIENLLENSLKYSKQGSQVIVRTEKSEGSRIRFEVQNEGIELSKAEWPKIFERHYRSPEVKHLPGNGLGLYLAKKIVEAHHGKIFPDCTEDLNTRFVVDLPAHAV